jgi:hypothetical protein
MRLLKQSSTAQVLTFLMVDSTDHVTPKTGLTPTVTLSKAGGSFASPAGAVSEIGNGWYKVAGNATDTATLGSLILHATGTAADPTDREYEVVAFDPQAASNLGLTNLDATVSSRSTYAGADTSGTTTLLSRLTSARAGYLDVLNGIVAAIWTAVTDSSGVTTLLSRIASALTITGGKVDVNDKTGFALTAAYDAAKTALQSGGNVVATNMRGTDSALLAADYVAPDNADIILGLNDLVALLARTDPTTAIGLIKVVTDKLTTALEADGASGYQFTALALENAPAGGGGASDPWEELAADHNTTGTMGAKMNAAGNAGDPWGTDLPGAYSGNQAGAIIGRFNIDPPDAPLIVVIAPDTDAQLTGYLITRNAYGEIQAGVTLRFTLTKAPAITGNSESTISFSETSDADGLLQHAFTKGATYSQSRGRDGAKVTFTVPDTADGNGGFALPEVIGSS